MEKLSNFIQSKIHIAEADLQIICSYFQERTLAKNSFLVKKGQLVTAYYFIQSGGIRIYLNHNDREITGWLAFKNDFFTELGSLTTGQPTAFNMQAIEDCQLSYIEKKDMDSLYQRYPAWQQFGRQLWEDAFIKVVNGILAYQTMTAEERYLAIMQQSDLLQKVPLRQLASYLGITPTSLSRLRKKIT